MSGGMFRETFEWGLNFPCDHGYRIPIRRVDGDDGTTITEVAFSPKQFQELLHQVTQEKFMEYDEEFGLSFKCRVILCVEDDGRMTFETVGYQDEDNKN